MISQSKEARRQQARKHVEYMDSHYKKQAEESVKSTILYDGGVTLASPPGTKKDTFKVADMDTVSAVFRFADEHTMVLNFASYRHPGGGFLNGSRAQEEALCLESNLYSILREFPDYYAENVRHINNNLYTDRALYTKNVIFQRASETRQCDVLTCASPNYSAARSRVSRKENTKALRSRIEFIVKIALCNDAKTLILGAFGCGVFGQNPEEVATAFKTSIEKYGNRNLTVIFAIPSGTNDNLRAFKTVFEVK